MPSLPYFTFCKISKYIQEIGILLISIYLMTSAKQSHLKTEKAPGQDGIPAELFKYGGDYLKRILLEVVRIM